MKNVSGALIFLNSFILDFSCTLFISTVQCGRLFYYISIIPQRLYMNKSCFLLLVLISCTSNFANQKTIYKKIQPINLASLPWEDEEWPNEPFRDYLQRCLDYQMKPQEFKKRRIVFRLFDLLGQQQRSNSALYDITTLQDLQLIAGKKENETYIAELVDRTKTEFGKVFLYGMLSSPTADINILRERQEVIKHLINNDELLTQLVDVYTQLAQSENMMLSLWGQDGFLNSTKRHYYSIPYFKKLTESLNRSSVALELKSLWNHQQRAVFLASGIFAAALLPVYGLSVACDQELPMPMQRAANKLQGSGGKLLALFSSISDHKLFVGATAVAAGITCAFACKEDYEWARDNVILDLCLQQKMILIARFLNGLVELDRILSAHPEFIAKSPVAAEIHRFMQEGSTKESIQLLFEFCESNTLQGDPSFFSFHGKVLAAFRLLYDLKDFIEPLLLSVGELDAFLSCAQLYNEFKDKRVSFSFPTYSTDKNPSIRLVEFWNPFIDAEKVVTNTIDLDGSIGKNMIITGPNAGGKSTLIKAVPINLILAQSICLVAAQEAEITPFDTIATYLNIVDDIAAGNSLFKAQVLRAQEMVNLVEQTPANKLSFVALDEMFNGTSANESMAAAYSVVNHIGKYENNICIVATHFPLLTQLERENNAFANYKVSVNVDDMGIHYPFKLEKGISGQHVALDILKQEGYDCSIINEATEILKTVSA